MIVAAAPAPATTPAPETTAVAPAPKYLGTFKNPSHDVKGDIFMLDQSTLYIQGFSFDGQAPDAYFWSDGIPIPYYTRYHLISFPDSIFHIFEDINVDFKTIIKRFHENYFSRSDPNVTMNLKKYSNEDVVLMLPPEKPTLEAMGHFQVWCNMFNLSLIHI